MEPEPKFLKINGIVLKYVNFKSKGVMATDPPTYHFDIETDDSMLWKPFEESKKEFFFARRCFRREKTGTTTWTTNALSSA